MAKKQGSVLVVDDDASILKLYSLILEKAGYEPDVAESASEALSLKDFKDF